MAAWMPARSSLLTDGSAGSAVSRLTRMTGSPADVSRATVVPSRVAEATMYPSQRRPCSASMRSRSRAGSLPVFASSAT